MMKTKISLIAMAFATLAACAQAPTGTTPVRQLDTTTLWSTGSFR
ncbi:hypothetical protein [Vannielia litorea]|uniref:Uncharacterized protein n=1 Tax=Vannielia litorea TaxID=1217970 RepID=A0A1N6FFN7_9RHOB|nr:hypothetical protein [Vannielia litorea]SIN94079.1 hypothetical protein SAMN05444002_1635 [Vannielia litorea]